MSTPPPPAPPADVTPPDARHTTGGKVLLAVAAALFVGWMSWLGYTALTKSGAPTISRAQAAAADVPVRAKLIAGADGKPSPVATVVEPLIASGPSAGTELAVTNLPASAGFTGEGEYLLLLTKSAPDGNVYSLAGQQRSPGADLEGVGPPLIYPWGEDVQKQAQSLYRAKD